MDKGAMICIPSFVEIGTGNPKLIRDDTTNSLTIAYAYFN
jgi:hypothetical protein